MKNLKKNCLILFFILEAGLYAQKTYYIDFAYGSDSNNGTTISTPWKNAHKLNGLNFFQPGDIILFKRGQEWLNQSFNIRSSGTEENPIVVGAYGQGERPIISGVSKINASFSPMGNGIYHADLSNPPGRLFKDINANGKIDDGEEMLKAYEKTNVGLSTYSLKNSCTTPLPIDEWFFDNSGLYIYSAQEPPEFSYLQSNNSNGGYYNFQVYAQHDIIFENLNLQGGVDCILIGSNYIADDEVIDDLSTNVSKNITFKNCEIGAYSSNGVKLRRVENVKMYNNKFDSKYKLKFGLTSQDCIISNDPQNPSYPEWTGSDARGNGDAIEVTRYGKDCAIYSNQFINWTHGAIVLGCFEGEAWGSNHGHCFGVFNNKVYNNSISGSDISYSRAFGVFGVANGTYENEIYNNLIKNTSIQSQIGGQRNSIHHNIFDGVVQSDLRSEDFSVAIKVHNLEQYFPVEYNSFDNNLFLNCTSAAIGVDSTIGSIQPPLPKVENNYFRNNIIYNCGKSTNGYAGIRIQSYPQGLNEGVNDNTYKNNLIYYKSTFIPITPKVSYHEALMTITEFNELNGANGYGDVMAANVNINPSFINLNNNYKLNLTSYCYNNGFVIPPSTYETDYYGHAFPSEIADIGHQEINPLVTNLIEEDCGRTLTVDDTSLSCYPLPNATNYKFQFTRALSTLNEDINSSSTTIDIADYYNLTWILPNVRYNVEVRGDGAYGEKCTIRTPYKTHLRNELWGETFEIGDVISCYPIPQGTSYTVRFTNSIGEHRWTNSNSTSFTIPNYSDFFINGAVYDVEIRENNQPYGKIGNIKIAVNEPFSQKGLITINDNFNAAYSIDIFPNPFDHFLNLESPDQIDSLILFDLSGRVLLKKENLGKQEILNLEFLPNGIYLLKIITKHSQITYNHKIIKGKR
jgi:hypothetical protein